MNQILEKLKNIDPRYVPALLAGVIAVFLAVDFLIVMRPQIGGIVSLSERNTQVKTDIMTLEANKQRLVAFQQNLENARRDTKNFDAMVRDKDGLPAVLKAISAFANEYGIKIDQLVPQPVDEKPVVANADGKYFGQSIFIVAYGGYHQFGKFMNRLEKEQIFWSLDNFVIMADGMDPQRQKVKMNIRVLIFQK